MLSHAAKVKRLTSRHDPVTIFDLETSSHLLLGHPAPDQASGERQHPATYQPGQAPAWAIARYGPVEPPKGYKVPQGRAMQLAATQYVWDAGSGRYHHSGRTMNRLFADPDLLPCCLNPAALATHGISLEDCQRQGLPPAQVWNEFLDIVDGGLLMGQNILGFDIPFANSELLRAGISAQFNPERAIDVLLLAREIWSLRTNRLRGLADFFGVQTDPTRDHDAMGDIETCWGVWEAMQPGLVDFARRFGSGAPPFQYRGQLGRLGQAWSLPDPSELVPQPGAAPPLGADGQPAG